MEHRSNQATPQRPEGERVLDAELVELDLNHFIGLIKDESTWKDSDRNSITLFKSDHMRIVLIGMHTKAELKTHQNEGMLSVQVLEGKIKFVTEQKTAVLKKGNMIVLHENIPHSVVALRKSFFLLTMAITGKVPGQSPSL